MHITVYGVGYVGLVTAACLADTGYKVLGIDVDARKVQILNEGRTFFYEHGIEDILTRNIAAGRLQFSTDQEKGVDFGDIQLITVGTPPAAAGQGAVDLGYVMAVADTIGRYMKNAKLVVVKSTVPVGTCDRVRATVKSALQQRNSDIAFDVAFNPEFLKEGAAVEDFCKPDRIIIGTSSNKTAETLKALYSPFNRNHDKIMLMDVRSAELTKYAANAMLATKISFMNEIANIAELLDADIEQVRHGIGADPRIGNHFIYPGCGYGGSCFPKDVRALVSVADNAGYDASLLRAVEQVNDRQKHRLFRKAMQHFGGAQQLAGKIFAVWGLSFKPRTDDIREASSLVLLEALLSAGATVQAYDPKAMAPVANCFSNHPRLQLKNSREECLTGAHALFVCTEWSEFRVLDTALMAEHMQQKVIFDGRNLYDPAELANAHFAYYGIGRGINTGAKPATAL